MKYTQYLLVLLVTALSLTACQGDSSGTRSEVEKLRRENKDLMEQLSMTTGAESELFDKYDHVLNSLDSISLLNDSLTLISDSGQTFDGEAVSDSLNIIIEAGKAEIRKLRSEIDQSGSNNETVTFIRKQLDRALNTIARLEKEKENLLADNEIITARLEAAESQLTEVSEDYADVRSDLDKEREKARIDRARQEDILRRLNADKARLARENQNKIDPLDAQFLVLSQQLEAVDKYFTKRRRGFVVRGKDEKELVRKELDDIVRQLGQAKIKGHNASINLLDRIYSEPMYEDYRPIK